MFASDTLFHYFYPRYSNNQRAKAIHSSTLLLLAVFILIYQFVLQAVPMYGLRVLGYAANISPSSVITLTNQKRLQAGVPALEYSDQLTEAAKAKGEHMLQYDYWSHVAPDGTEPWKFFSNIGYKYRYAGENLARDFSSPESAVEAWITSPSHKDNLLSEKYQEIGIAVVEGELDGVDTTIIVQLFGTRLNNVNQVPITQTKDEINKVAAKTSSAPQPASVPLTVQVTPASIENHNDIIQFPEPVKEADKLGFLFSPFVSTRNISVITLILLIVIMVIDWFAVSNKKISRISGRPFAHMAFLGMVLVLVIIAKAGRIL